MRTSNDVSRGGDGTEDLVTRDRRIRNAHVTPFECQHPTVQRDGRRVACLRCGQPNTRTDRVLCANRICRANSAMANGVRQTSTSSRKNSSNGLAVSVGRLDGASCGLVTNIGLVFARLPLFARGRKQVLADSISNLRQSESSSEAAGLPRTLGAPVAGADLVHQPSSHPERRRRSPYLGCAPPAAPYPQCVCVPATCGVPHGYVDLHHGSIADPNDPEASHQVPRERPYRGSAFQSKS